ncbi:MAG: nucleotidyltransferase family protein [Oscillospiraceae bacterium]|jgi:CTP:molybdopterin cytidylyltransferase MocA|nr:nucleotidyltransferase family protein [Oscillospiraceae bacterium]
MHISALILAAGFSSRMGAFKPLLPVVGLPAIRKTVDSASPARNIVVVTGHRRAELERALSATPAVCVFNSSYSDGMFSSLQTGLAALPDNTDAFFMLPGDCCAVASSTLSALIAAYSGEIIYPKYLGRRGHPPLVPARHIAGLLAYCGADGARGYLSAQPCSALETDDPGILLDMDTPEDYARLTEYVKHLQTAEAT